MRLVVFFFCLFFLLYFGLSPDVPFVPLSVCLSAMLILPIHRTASDRKWHLFSVDGTENYATALDVIWMCFRTVIVHISKVSHIEFYTMRNEWESGRERGKTKTLLSYFSHKDGPFIITMDHWNWLEPKFSPRCECSACVSVCERSIFGYFVIIFVVACCWLRWNDGRFRNAHIKWLKHSLPFQNRLQFMNGTGEKF